MLITYPITGSVSIPNGTYINALDYASVQDALNAVALLGGGAVYLPPGVYTEQITLPHRTSLFGSGRSSVIKLPDNSTGPNVKNAVRSNFCGLYHLCLDGNAENQTEPNGGVLFANDWAYDSALDDEWDGWHVATDVFITNTKGNGVECRGRGGNTFTGVRVLRAGIHSFVTNYDNHFVACDSGRSGKAGYIINGSSTRLTACKSWYSGMSGGQGGEVAGFWIKSTSGCISACEAQDNLGPGFSFDGAKQIAVSSCLADSNGGTGGFDFWNAQDCIVQGVARQRTGSGVWQTQQYALCLRNGSKDNIIDVISKHGSASPLHTSSTDYADNIFRVIHNGIVWGP